MKSLLLSAALLTAFAASAQTTAPVTAAVVAADYSKLVYASYADTLTTAQALNTAIAAFNAAPSAEGLAKARTAWMAAREFYGQTEAFRFYAGPIDDKNGPEGRINA